MSKRIKALIVSGVVAASMAIPAVASASPAAGTCVAAGVKNLQSAIPGVASSGPGALAGVIQDHLRNPGNWAWC
jgi:hypothetical protein